MAAPYRMHDGANGFFQLEPETADGTLQPTQDEAELARAINEKVAWAHDYPDDSRPLLPAFVDGLRAIAEQGLTGDPRDLAAAKRRFEHDYPAGPEPPPIPEAQPETGLVAQPAPSQGPFTVELDQNDQIRVASVPGVKPTDAQLAFVGDLDRRERLIRAIYQSAVPDEARRRRLLHGALERLQWAGQLGLEGANPDVRIAQLALQSVLLDTLQEHGAAIRDGYLRQLGWAYAAWVGFFTAVAVIYMLVVGQLPASQLDAPLVVPNLAVMLLIIAVWFLCFGAWLSAVLRVEPDSPEVLDSIFQTTLGPKLRVVYVMGFSILALLLLHKRAIVFAFGGSGGEAAFTTEHVFHYLSASILTGAFLGLGEAALPNAVVQRSATLIAALAPK